MPTYRQQCQAIEELSTLIQTGDLLTLERGGRYVTFGSPQNHDTQRWRHAWLVAVLMGGCWIPVNLNGVVAVERDGRCIWTVDGERLPVQQSMF